MLERILAPDGDAPTKVQKHLFGEVPAPGSDLRAAAKDVACSLARNARRRPPSEAELDVLLRVFDLVRDKQLEYSAALHLMLKAVLVSPQFLFITPASDAEPGRTIVPLDDYQATGIPVVLSLVGDDARCRAVRLGRRWKTSST